MKVFYVWPFVLDALPQHFEKMKTMKAKNHVVGLFCDAFFLHNISTTVVFYELSPAIIFVKTLRRRRYLHPRND